MFKVGKYFFFATREDFNHPLEEKFLDKTMVEETKRGFLAFVEKHSEDLKAASLVYEARAGVVIPVINIDFKEM